MNTTKSAIISSDEKILLTFFRTDSKSQYAESNSNTDLNLTVFHTEFDEML